MKHTFFILGVAVLLLAVTACSQDEPTGDSLPGGKYPLELTAANLHEAVATLPPLPRPIPSSGGRQAMKARRSWHGILTARPCPRTGLSPLLRLKKR